MALLNDTSKEELEEALLVDDVRTNLLLIRVGLRNNPWFTEILQELHPEFADDIEELMDTPDEINDDKLMTEILLAKERFWKNEASFKSQLEMAEDELKICDIWAPMNRLNYHFKILDDYYKKTF